MPIGNSTPAMHGPYRRASGPRRVKFRLGHAWLRHLQPQFSESENSLIESLLIEIGYKPNYRPYTRWKLWLAISTVKRGAAEQYCQKDGTLLTRVKPMKSLEDGSDRFDHTVYNTPCEPDPDANAYNSRLVGQKICSGQRLMLEAR